MIKNTPCRAAALGLLAMSVLAGPADAAGDSGAQTAPGPEVVMLASSAVNQRFNAYITGYAYWDNTPPGSAEISKPVVHRRAGGTGTYIDPVTIAVGHKIEGGRQTLDFPAGTVFYIEKLRKYAIVEDVCGDGNRPQDGPCHAGYHGHPWLDVYIGGASSTASATAACARRITALQSIVLNPRADYPVHAGEIASSGCRVF
jgi:hypothetical protein